ncbi:hypothetical protein N865_19500 [Intrasporangium oryzae NRRL B-24470]|uniref:Uncharacterized protein n=1 Tax=Intrasporangium oryzae NRRL B-24470 TaxID=1386089 RepID=W9G1Y8_9MICO|nr:hypothetical protein [Intrasporangium oryzae]EWS99979.1 hypothetical protein N865_19500 [Intrasporangium oryzae NRRL B-24470]
MNDPDLDAEFARIIAGWDNEAPDPTPAARPKGEDEGAGGSAGEGAGEGPAVGAAGGPEAADGAQAERHSEPGAPAQPSPPAAGEPHDAGSHRTGGNPAAEAGTPDTLGLPIAPSAGHVWRGSEPARDDVDDLLDAVDPDEEHFVPPSDPDLPSAEDDPMFWAIVVGLAGGPLLLLYLLFFDRDGSPWWVVTGLAMIVVGFVLLVLRGGTERDPSDDGTRV